MIENNGWRNGKEWRPFVNDDISEPDDNYGSLIAYIDDVRVECNSEKECTYIIKDGALEKVSKSDIDKLGVENLPEVIIGSYWDKLKHNVKERIPQDKKSKNRILIINNSGIRRNAINYKYSGYSKVIYIDVEKLGKNSIKIYDHVLKAAIDMSHTLSIFNTLAGEVDSFVVSRDFDEYWLDIRCSKTKYSDRVGNRKEYYTIWFLLRRKLNK